MSSLEKINELKKEIAKLQESASKEFEQKCVELLAEYPMFQSFAWTAYVPGFNDGDPCLYEVHADEPLIDGKYACEYEDGENYNKANELANKVAELVYSIDKDILENIGEGKFVVGKKGLRVL